MPVMCVNAGGDAPPPPPSVFVRKVFVLATTLIFCQKRFLAILIRLVFFGGLSSTCKHVRADGETEGQTERQNINGLRALGG